MKIAGLEKFSLIDYPKKISCIIFLFGCNFRCGFCHNPELVLGKNEGSFSEEEILNFLEKRKKQLDGVCISGGEPLMTLKKSFVKKIKDLGYFVKIDTNGSFPERLKDFLEEKLVDFVAMDLKSSPKNYSKVAGVLVDLKKIEESIKLIVNSGVDYEFRTTIVEGFHSKEEIKDLGKWVKNLIGKKAKKYSIQGFKNKGKLLDESFGKKKDTSEKELKEIKKELADYFEEVEVRV